MAIFLETNTNGFDAEGIGSVAQWNLVLYGLCKKLGVNFFAKPFVNINHYQYNNIPKDKWSEDFTKFFNLNKSQKFDVEYDFSGKYQDLLDVIDENKNSQKNICIEVDKNFIVQNGFSIIDQFFENQYLKNITQNLVYRKQSYFDSTKYNISLHLRSLNSCDVPTYPEMETYLVYKDSSHIKNIFDILKEKLCDKKVCVYIHSQGDKNNFIDLLEFSEENFEVVLKLNEHPIDDIYHMSNADLLIMSKSSYSWISHLLNFNQTLVRDNFYQPIYPNRIFLDSDYKFDPSELKL
jgi:hypothetical protein